VSLYLRLSVFRPLNKYFVPYCRFVPIKQLAAWWILEEIFDDICLFLEATFGKP
jgi:hypothetical protein